MDFFGGCLIKFKSDLTALLVASSLVATYAKAENAYENMYVGVGYANLKMSIDEGYGYK